MTAVVAGSATAHRVETDFTGENVRSYPATVCVRGREPFAICPASSRASAGSRPCSARKNSRATSVRTLARSAAGSRAPAGRAGRAVVCRDAAGDLEPEWANGTIDDLERRPQLGHLLR